MPHDAKNRQPLIDLVLEKQSEAFKAAFRSFAEDFWATRTGTVADVVELYDAADLPKPVNDYRCIGGIIQSMVRRGAIVSVGTEKAKDGSGRNMDIYSRVSKC